MNTSNYPPGVTGNEPQIAGETHHGNCPQHEDNPWEHICSHKPKGVLRVRYDEPGGWYLECPPVNPHADFCLYCGDELPSMRCQCDEIRQSLREQAEERREAQRHEQVPLE